VTVTYNSADVLRACWSAADKPFDWIVVDNGSQDSSADVAEQLGARVVRLSRNVGFATANNLGVRQSAGPYLLFANPDLVLEPGGLNVLRAHLDVYGGLVAPQLLSTGGEPQPNGRGLPYVTARLGNRRVWPFSRLHAAYRVLAGPGEARWVCWLAGAAVAIRRSDFEAIGGWNERFFLYYEDIELGLRAWTHGLPVTVLGDVRWVHHWRRATNTFRWSREHNLELKSARTFYGMHPEFVLGLPRPRGRHTLAARLTGRRVTAVDPSEVVARRPRQGRALDAAPLDAASLDAAPEGR
jgi:GT2 family glycosyltransferase